MNIVISDTDRKRVRRRRVAVGVLAVAALMLFAITLRTRPRQLQPEEIVRGYDKHDWPGNQHRRIATPMITSPLQIEILGIHRVIPTRDEFEEARRLLYGDARLNDDITIRKTEAHFADLYLIEIRVEPVGASLNWSEIVQPDEREPRSNWQVAYDERSTGKGRWAFFLHYLNRSKPLSTPAGPRHLPESTPRPERLNDIEYVVP